MSGVMRPVGPEPSETYWVRRAVVIGSALVLLIVFLLLLVNLNGGQQAAPAATASPLPPITDPLTPTPTPTASASDSPSAGASTSPGASGSASTYPSASTGASSSASASTGARTSARTSASPSVPSASTSAGAPATNAAPTSNGDQKTLLVCDATTLRTKLTASDHTPKVGQKVTFSMSVTNGSPSPCVVSLNAKDYTLKVYSGNDRIWSTQDCTKMIPDDLRQLAPKQSMSWTVAWDGRRSAGGCGRRPEMPRPGTYWAIAKYGAIPSLRERMLLG